MVHPNLAKFNGNTIVRILKDPPTSDELQECADLLSQPTAPVQATKKEMARTNAVFSLVYAYFLSVCASQEIEPQIVSSQAHLKLVVAEAVTGKLRASDIGPDGLSIDEALHAGCHRQVLCDWRWNVAGQRLVQFLQGNVSVSYDPDTCLPKFNELI